jgi:uncharacterized membrane protein YdbT with pleckstrin-like domain
MAIRVPTDISMTEGEIPVWFGQMSWLANWFWLLLAIFSLLTIVLFIFAIIFFAIAFLNVYTSEYFVSDRRIYYKYGWISRRANDIKMEWVTNTSIAQGIFGRILNYGNILIATPGEYTGTSMFVGVSDPMMIKGMIETRLVNYKKVEEINKSIRTITDEFKMGRLDESRYNSLKSEYEMEIKKYS